MTRQELNRLTEQAEGRKLQLRVQKGEEYTLGNEDVLINFKDTAKQVGLSPLQVWFIFAKKHFDAIGNYARVGVERSGEPVEGRIDDLEVYCMLLRGLIKEHKEEANGIVVNPERFE